MREILIETTGPVIRLLSFGVVALAFSVQAMAGNQPCSGKRGGVVSCVGSQFMCADGGVSNSTKSCQAYGLPSASSSVAIKEPKRKKASTK